MANYKRKIERKRIERRRKNIFISVLAVGVLVVLALPWIRSQFEPDFQFTDFFMVVDDLEIVTTETGLQYQDLEIGTGPEAKTGDQVEVHYIGWLTDGTQFDSSIQRNLPFDFTLGRGQVISGWDEGVVGMRVGGLRILMIPPDLGYGPRDIPGIPPSSILLFQVELLTVTPQG
ncbi:MAG: FKBP-type peptidyl-prolyl cis-trans isomerase [Anaerolineae bacterium]|nr:FKBP-type peptidyl-prolyl cis-trans isomerase [Anaerolineae bacterium]